MSKWFCEDSQQPREIVIIWSQLTRLPGIGGSHFEQDEKLRRPFLIIIDYTEIEMICVLCGSCDAVVADKTLIIRGRDQKLRGVLCAGGGKLGRRRGGSWLSTATDGSF